MGSMFFYIPGFSHPQQHACDVIFCSDSVAAWSPQTPAPRQQDTLGNFVQTVVAPVWNCSQTSTLMGAGVKWPGISGLHSSAPVPQECFSSLSSVFHGNRMFFPIAAGWSCEASGDRQREVFGGKISRESLMQCTCCLWDTCNSTKANSLWQKGKLVSPWIKLPARRNKGIGLLPWTYLNWNRLYVPLRTQVLKVAGGSALSLDASSITVAFLSAPYPHKLRNRLSIFSQTSQRCPRGSFSLAGLGEFRLLEGKKLVNASAVGCLNGTRHWSFHVKEQTLKHPLSREEALIKPLAHCERPIGRKPTSGTYRTTYIYLVDCFKWQKNFSWSLLVIKLSLASLGEHLHGLTATPARSVPDQPGQTLQH